MEMADGKSALKNDNPQTGVPPGESQKKAIRTIVVLNNNKYLTGGLNFLQKRNYQITVVNRISEAVKQLPILKPHAILLSWNLRNTDVRKAYKILTERFNLICIVFAEDNTTRTTASLMSSGIPHSLLAPVSGPSIHMRVQALLRSRLTPLTEKQKRHFSQTSPGEKKTDSRLVTGKDFGKVRVQIKDVPADTQWRRTGEAQGGASRWEASFQRPGQDTMEIYFFKGKTAPKFDRGTRSWSFASEDENPPVFFETRPVTRQNQRYEEESGGPGEAFLEIQERQKGIGFSITQEQDPSPEMSQTKTSADEMSYEAQTETPDILDPWEESGTGEDLKELEKYALEVAQEFESNELAQGNESEQKEQEDPPLNAPETGEAPQRSRADFPAKEDLAWDSGPTPDSGKPPNFETESIVLGSARKALESVVSPAEFHVQRLNQVAQLALTLVDSKRAKGYLFGVSGSGISIKELMARLVELFWSNMEVHGEISKSPHEVVELPVSQFPFIEWARESAEFVLTKPHGDDTIGLAYLKIQSFPQLLEMDNDKVMGVSLQDDLVPGTRVPFDIYIHLPKNKKFLRYVNKGDILTSNMTAKLIRFGVKNLFVRKDESTLFLAYCARNSVEAAKKSKK